jgi:aryl-alcohol dehydrogenase-like predicted oxidoreductase
MRYKVLGNSGVFVSEVCLGAMTLSPAKGRFEGAGTDPAEVDRIVRHALDAGINLIDTANVYGESEEIIGRAIKKLGVERHHMMVATKVEHATGPGPNDGGATRTHKIDQLKNSLRRLGSDYIDLYQLHGWDPVTPIEETIRALDDLVRQGHVRHVGVSNWSAWQTMKGLGVADRLRAVPLQSVQAYYSLADRALEREIGPMIESEKLALLVYSPLAGGYLSGKYRVADTSGRRNIIPFPPIDEAKCAPVLQALDQVAQRHSATPATVALAWLLHQPIVTSVILGVKRVSQLEDNLKAIKLQLSAGDLNELDTASALSKEYPAWAFEANSASRALLLETGSSLTKPTRRHDARSAQLIS